MPVLTGSASPGRLRISHGASLSYAWIAGGIEGRTTRAGAYWLLVA
ncbi:MAG: hypothetical protein HKP20_05380 [Akkermansiaceae bacterium]|nr:hypothetical protein [Akkermansiaceae bacterium]